MADKRIEVHAFPGMTGDKCPRKFDLGEETIEVVETLENWVEERGKENGDRHFYKVKGDDEQLYTLYFDSRKNDWFCEG